MSQTVTAFCSSCGAEVTELHTYPECVEFLNGRVKTLEEELGHTRYILKHFKEHGWRSAACVVIDDAEKWLERAKALIPPEFTENSSFSNWKRRGTVKK